MNSQHLVADQSALGIIVLGINGVFEVVDRLDSGYFPYWIILTGKLLSPRFVEIPFKSRSRL